MVALNVGKRGARFTELDDEVLPIASCDIADVVNLAGGERREGTATGVRALLLAILEDGIRCYLSPRAKLAYEAERWVEGRGKPAAIPFALICASFGLEVSSAQRALRAMRASGQPSRQLRRVRPNVRHTPRVALRARRGPRVVRRGETADQRKPVGFQRDRRSRGARSGGLGEPPGRSAGMPDAAAGQVLATESGTKTPEVSKYPS